VLHLNKEGVVRFCGFAHERRHTAELDTVNNKRASRITELLSLLRGVWSGGAGQSRVGLSGL
jgi:hypothetical protein